MSMKKICALLLCCVMLFTLAGCKSKAVKEMEVSTTTFRWI